MYFALLDNNLGDSDLSFLFRNPLKFISCTDPSQVVQALEEVAREVKKGRYACGYMDYEAAEAFGFQTRYNPSQNTPLLCFGIFADREALDATQVHEFLDSQDAHSEGHLINTQPETAQEDYYRAVYQIHRELELGNSYQVNYTTRYHGRVGGCVNALYSRLRHSQKVQYGAYLKFPDRYILSRSPELFFKKANTKIITKPMKGTSARCTANKEKDQDAIRELQTDPKQQSENVMIVDLLRNDLGQIAKAGTVDVEKLFEIETYSTVHQMTSTVSCLVEEGKSSLIDLMKALFPCGSITGAPKKRTCEIIAANEASPRGIYTGTIGMIGPDNEMCFNVAIRTLSIDMKRHFSFGVGGGIVIDSSPEGELAECKTKSRFLFDKQPNLSLIEALRWSKSDGLVNLDRHIARLSKSCLDLGFPPLSNDIHWKIESLSFDPNKDQKLRIAYSRAGEINFTISDILLSDAKEKNVVLSPKRLLSDDFLRRYKTTNRTLLDEERGYYSAQFGVYDVLFANDNGYLTEASYHNLFLRFGSKFHTPVLAAGLLDGVGRSIFINNNRDHVVERLIPVQDLYTADEVLLVSSVRGCVPVKVLADV